jgi:hypothetical protein
MTNHSSLIENLLGFDSEEDELRRLKYTKDPPIYTRTSEFMDFIITNKVKVRSERGYMHIKLNQSYYFPGDWVQGCIYLDLFNPVTANNVLFISVKGVESSGKFHKKKLVVKKIDPNLSFDSSPQNISKGA